MRDYRTHRPGTYQEMTSGFRWEVPASYNLAADVLDKHEPDRPAMRFVSDEGRDERWTFGDMRRLTDRTANTLRELGVAKGDRVAVMAPASPEIAASFLATYKVEAILLSMSVLYGDDAIVYRLNDSEAKVLVTSAAHRDRVAALLDKAPSVEHLVVVGGGGAESFEELTGAAVRPLRDPGHRPRHPGPALLHLGHDRAGQGHPARPPLPARARGVPVQPRRPGGRAVPLHRRVGLDRRDRARHPRALALRGGDAGPRPQGRLRPGQGAAADRRPRGRQPVHHPRPPSGP